MAYPDDFHRLVIIGNLYSDVFNTSLTIAPIGLGGGLVPLEVTPTLLTAVANAVDNFWEVGPSTGPQITADAKLTSIKLNQIGTDGLYVSGTTNEHFYTVPVPGTGAGGSPPQLSTVVTTRTFQERGRASKGRMFLPVCNGFQALGSDGRATAANALRVANAVAKLITDINAAYLAADTPGSSVYRVSVPSNIGSGLFRVVTGVTVGRVTDTMRSRRNKQIEDPQANTTAIPPVA